MKRANRIMSLINLGLAIGSILLYVYYGSPIFIGFAILGVIGVII